MAVPYHPQEARCGRRVELERPQHVDDPLGRDGVHGLGAEHMCSTRVHCVNTCVSALSEHTGEHDVFMNTRSNTMYFHSKYFSSGAPVALDTRIHGYTDTRIHCVPSSDIMIFMAVISNIVCGITAMIFLTPSVISIEDAISC